MMKKPEAPAPAASTPQQASFSTQGPLSKKRPGLGPSSPSVTGTSAITSGRPSLLGGS